MKNTRRGSPGTGTAEPDNAAPQHRTAQVFQTQPSAAMRPFVKRYLVVTFPDSHDDVHLPDTSPVAAFTLRGGCQLAKDQWVPPAAFTGLSARLRSHAHRQGHCVLLAHFTPAGAGALLSTPLDDLAGQTVGLAELLKPAVSLADLHEELTQAGTPAQCVRLLERFLVRQARERTPDPLVEAAAAWLQRPGAPGVPVRMRELARYIGLSQSALERRFRRVAGLTPKAFARIVRLRRALHLCQNGASFSAAASEAGYFDQPHFVNEVRTITGYSPTRLLPRLSRT